MSKFVGFTCDGCGSIWVEDSLTKVMLTFTFGDGDKKSYVKDHCPACMGTEYPPSEDWVAVPPKKRWTTKPDTIVHTTIPGLEVSV